MTIGDLISPWHPDVSEINLKHLGKLQEELGELSAATARCIIQGILEQEPVTGKINKQWLEEEIADVKANIELVEKHFHLDTSFISERKIRKLKNLQRWHGGLE